MFHGENGDVLNYFIADIEPASMINLSLASSYLFNSLNNHTDYWINRISNDFNICRDYLSQQREVLKTHSIKLVLVYKNLGILAKNKNRLPAYLKFAYEDDDNYPFIFAACTDNIRYFSSIIPYEELMEWAEMSLFAGCKEIIIYSLNCHSHTAPEEGKKEYLNILQKKYLDIASRAGRKDILMHFLKQDNFLAKPDISTLLDAACSGNISLFLYLIEPENKFNLSVTSYLKDENDPDNKENSPLNSAAFNGDIKLVQLILIEKIKPSQVTLYNAIQSGCLELVRYLIDNYAFELKRRSSRERLVAYGIHSGNIDLYKYLTLELKLLTDIEIYNLDSANFAKSRNIALHSLYWEKRKHILSADDINLNIFFGRSGNVSLLKQLATDNDLIKKIGLQCLDNAVENSHFNMVKYLIEVLKIKPSNDTYFFAQLCNSISIVKYLAQKDIYSYALNDVFHTGSTFAIRKYVSGTISFVNLLYSNQKRHEESQKDSFDAPINDALMNAFKTAPCFYLDYISRIFNSADNLGFDEMEIQMLRQNIDILSEMDLGKLFLPEYKAIYENRIREIVAEINNQPGKKLSM